MRKIFVNFPICDIFKLTVDDAYHVMTVLRHKIGDTLLVTDLTGAAYECTIIRAEHTSVFLKPDRKISDPEQKSSIVILAAAILKGDKFEWVVQKATELGVDVIVPVQMKHCVVKLNDIRRQEKKERWQRIAKEAAKQCGRSHIPVVEHVTDITGLISVYGDKRFIVPYERETFPLCDACHDIGKGDIVICIGPEGGFADEEISELTKKVPWCRTVSLGPRILRAETASLAALSIIMYERGFI